MTESSPFLTEDLSGTPVIYPVQVPRGFHELEPDFYFSCFRFLRMLSHFDYVDVCTYSYSYNDSSIIVRRLLTGLRPETSIPKDAEHRISKGMHAKIYLCYMKAKLHSVFTGSFNLAHSTNPNVMVRIRGAHPRKMFVSFFNYHWQNPKK